jgi:hypothetical protein
MAMVSAKELQVSPVSAKDANAYIAANHYSGKVAPNSQVHLGVFLHGRMLGAMQFGPSINKKGTIRLVEGTGWNGFIELNRMAFSDVLPRNSESRAIGIAMRLLRKRYPHLDWVVSFADATQCGDGTIYRASGFVLTDIRKNEALRRDPKSGEVMHVIQAHHLKRSKEFRSWEAIPGWQLRYVYFLKPHLRERLTVPEIPFDKIGELGVSMYRGSRLESVDSDAPTFRVGEGGASPTSGLHTAGRDDG